MWDVVDVNFLRPIDPLVVAYYNVMNCNNEYLKGLFLGDYVLINVHEGTSGKKLWNKLGDMFQAKYLLNWILLRKNLNSLRMEEGGWITDHLEAFNILVAALSWHLMLSRWMKRINVR